MISRHPRSIIDILRRREAVAAQTAILADVPDVASGSGGATSTSGGAPPAAQAIEERVGDPSGPDLYAGRVWDIAGQPYVYSGALKKFVRVGAGAKIALPELDPTGSVSGQAILSTGPATDPAWGAVSGGGGGSGGLTPIAQVVLLADTATIDFSGIPATFEDLLLEFNGRTDGANRQVRVRYNGDAGANYNTNVSSSGGAATFLAQTSALWGEIAAGTDTASYSGTVIHHLPKYRRTTFFHSAWTSMARPDGPYAEVGSHQWLSAAAINQITLLFTDATKFKAGTVVTLYGSGGTAGAPGGGSMPVGLTKIGEVVLGIDTATIDFSGIPATYEDLLLTATGRLDSALYNVSVRFNGDAGANYDSDRWNRFGSQQIALATQAQIGQLAPNTNPAGLVSGFVTTIPKYARTDFFKNWLTQNATIDANTTAQNLIGTWRSAAAINQITLLFTDGTKFKAGTVVSLYGYGGLGSRPIKDLAWNRLVPPANAADDEFDKGTIDPLWTQVDGVGGHLATWTEKGDILSVLNPAGDAAGELHAMVKAIPSLAIGSVIQCAFRGLSIGQANPAIGLMFADGNVAGAGAQIAATMDINSATGVTERYTGYNARTNATAGGTVSGGTRFLPILFVRLTWVAANSFKGEWSPDGITWTDLAQGTQAFACTPTFAGVFVRGWGSGTPWVASFEHFRVS